MTYTKKGDPIKLPGKNNDYIIGGKIKKGSPTNFYAKADEREGELQRKWKHIKLENMSPPSLSGVAGLMPASGGLIVVEPPHESHSSRMWITCG